MVVRICQEEKDLKANDSSINTKDDIDAFESLPDSNVCRDDPNDFTLNLQANDTFETAVSNDNFQIDENETASTSTIVNTEADLHMESFPINKRYLKTYSRTSKINKRSTEICEDNNGIGISKQMCTERNTRSMSKDLTFSSDSIELAPNARIEVAPKKRTTSRKGTSKTTRTQKTTVHPSQTEKSKEIKLPFEHSFGVKILPTIQNTEFYCTTCNSNFITESALWKHSQQCRKTENTTQHNPKSKLKFVNCSFCGKKMLGSYNIISSHMKINHGLKTIVKKKSEEKVVVNKNHQCTVCHKYCLKADDLVRHLNKDCKLGDNKACKKHSIKRKK